MLRGMMMNKGLERSCEMWLRKINFEMEGFERNYERLMMRRIKIRDVGGNFKR